MYSHSYSLQQDSLLASPRMGWASQLHSFGSFDPYTKQDFVLWTQDLPQSGCLCQGSDHSADRGLCDPPSHPTQGWHSKYLTTMRWGLNLCPQALALVLKQDGAGGPCWAWLYPKGLARVSGGWWDLGGSRQHQSSNQHRHISLFNNQCGLTGHASWTSALVLGEVVWHVIRFKKKPIGLWWETRFESYLGLLLAIRPSTRPSTFVSNWGSLHHMISNASCSKIRGNKTK